jgi:hypothetical protein
MRLYREKWRLNGLKWNPAGGYWGLLARGDHYPAEHTAFQRFLEIIHFRFTIA